MGLHLNNEKAQFRTLLSNVNFVFLWLAQFICQFADRMFVYILIYSIYEVSNRSNLGTSLSSVAFGVPALLFSIPFGVLVDRFHKKQILFISNFLRAILITLIVCIPALENSLFWLFALSFVLFTISQIFIPAELAAITCCVPKKELILANSLFMGTWMLASVLSFAIAVPITYHFGINTTYAVIAIMYLLAAGFILLLRITDHTTPAVFNYKSFRREIRTGIRFVVRHRIVFYSMLKMGFGISIFAMLSTLSIGFANNLLQLPKSDFGYLVAIAGLGMGVGIGCMSILTKRFSNTSIVFFGFSIVSFMLMALGFTTTPILAYILVFILGFGNAFITAPMQTIIQERTPKSIQGKVFSVQNLVASFAFTLPPVVAGLLADMFGYRAIFVILGIIALTFNLLSKKIRK